MSFDLLIENVNIATMVGDDYGILAHYDIGATGGRIIHLAPTSKPTPTRTWLTPGLIDCHTHLIYAGNRANEFEARLNGKTYQEISAAGGGILSTVAATRAASEDALLESAQNRLAQLCREGVTTVEVKSGYGLDLETESKMLRVAAELKGAKICRTLLAAHAVPSEFNGDKEGYVAYVENVMIPALASECDAVDAFCEGIAFSPTQTQLIFDAAKKFGLPVKLHADQLSDLGGAGLAAVNHALSADHVEFTSEESVQRMKQSGTVAVLLPGAFYYLRETQKPPIDYFRKCGIPMAVATDHNPGTSPCLSLLLCMNMACVLFGLTPVEALQGVTKNAAKALGLEVEIGSIDLGKRADFALYEIDHPRDLASKLGTNPCVGRYIGGVRQPD
jgi:imidazolonepropionase